MPIKIHILKNRDKTFDELPTHVAASVIAVLTVGQDSILGAITDEMRGDFGEWCSSDVDEEDGGYVEDEEDWEE